MKNPGGEERDAIKVIVEAAAADSENLRLLQSNPEELATRYRLNTNELQALKLADVLIHINPRRPAGGGTTTSLTFDTGSTITAGVFQPTAGVTFQTGTTITASGIRELLTDIVSNSQLLQRLRTDPGAVLKELGIDQSQLDRVRNARIGVNLRPAAITFQTGTTITV